MCKTEKNFVNNFNKTSEKKLVGGFDNYCCVRGFKSAFYDKNREKTNISSFIIFKVGLSPSKKQFFTFFNEFSLKLMKNAFYFILKAFFVLKIFKFLPWIFGHVEKTAWLENGKVNFKIYVDTAWLMNSYNTHIVYYFTK